MNEVIRAGMVATLQECNKIINQLSEGVNRDLRKHKESCLFAPDVDMGLYELGQNVTAMARVFAYNAPFDDTDDLLDED